ncbi:MAG: acylphosphatase [Chloroflexota bacterium]
MSRRRIAARVEGLVQGVGFRRWVKRQADRLECDGWVRNEADGSVMLEAEGAPAQVASLEALVRRGPPGAWVRAAVVRELPVVGGSAGFTIRTGHHTGD